MHLRRSAVSRPIQTFNPLALGSSPSGVTDIDKGRAAGQSARTYRVWQPVTPDRDGADNGRWVDGAGRCCVARQPTCHAVRLGEAAQRHAPLAAGQDLALLTRGAIRVANTCLWHRVAEGGADTHLVAVDVGETTGAVVEALAGPG